MRYTSQAEETSIWIVLSALWACAGLIAWSLAVGGSAKPTPTDGATLVILACFLSGITMVLRLPILADVPTTTCSTNQLVWLLTTIATINWLGYCGLRATLPIDIVPTALLLVAGEVWTYRKVNRETCLPLVDSFALTIQKRLSKWDALPTNISTGAAQEADEEVDVSSSQQSPYTRETFEGIDENGARYLSGNIRVELEPRQQTDSIVVAFCPPFAGTPDVQLETEPVHSPTSDQSLEVDQEAADADEVNLDVHVSNCTPVGMRIGLRRSAADSTFAQDCMISWYAVLPKGKPKNEALNASLP